MTRTVHHNLLLSIALATCSIATPAAAQSAPAPRSTEPSADSMTVQDREMLAAAEQLATESAQALEGWITSQAVSEDRLFARFYYPIKSTDPQKFTTSYDTFAERDLVGHEDRVLARSPVIQYAIVTDLNGYVPAHNSRYAQPLTGNLAMDYQNNRTKRILGDTASMIAARSEARYLLQRTKTETGELIYDISVPVTVRGKHWGCARVGYRHVE